MIASPGSVVAAVSLALVVLAGGGCAPPAPKPAKEAVVQPAPVLPQAQPIEVPPIPELTLAPGEEKSTVVVVDRKGNEGAIKAEVTDLPTGVTAVVKPVTEAEGSASIEITAAADSTLGDVDAEQVAKVLVEVGDKKLEKVWKILVPKVPRPDVAVQPPLMIQPGTSMTWNLPIDRRGFEGPIDFQAKPSSASVKAEAAPAQANDGEVRLQIAIAADAPDGQTSCALEWTAYGRTTSVEMPVRIIREPFSLPAVVPVTLRPGEKQEKKLVMKRAYAGPVSLALGPLPAGVSASPSSLTLDADTAAITFSADASAPEGVTIVPVRASVGHLSAPGLVTVRVLGDTARETLPGDVHADLPERAPRGGVGARLAPAARAGLARLYGATEDSGPAVMRALRWLASQQADSGAWRSVADAGAAGPAGTAGAVGAAGAVGTVGVVGAAGTVGAEGGSVVATAVALLPFLAEGLSHETASVPTPDTEAYPDVIRKGLLFLGASQPEDGAAVGAIGTSMTAHLLGLVAFSEAFALANDDSKSRDHLKIRVKLAVDRLVRFQEKRGEWAVSEGAAARDTALAVVALQAARSCGIGVPGGPLNKAAKHLETYRTGDPPPGSRFSPSPMQRADAELSALCLLATLGQGRSHDAPDIVAGCDFIAGFAPAVGAARTERSPLFFVVAGEALRTVEGERYDAWNAAVRSFLTARQVREGDLAGSWDPAIFGGQVGDAADRVWATACATLCLQSHFRSLPLSRLAP